MNKFWEWTLAPAAPWKFWMPQSGAIGGMLAGVALGLVGLWVFA